MEVIHEIFLKMPHLLRINEVLVEKKPPKENSDKLSI